VDKLLEYLAKHNGHGVMQHEALDYGMEAGALILYTVLQVCMMIAVISRALPSKEQQTRQYVAQGNLLPILFCSLVGYLVFLFV
jgi:hypothetical protein